MELARTIRIGDALSRQKDVVLLEDDEVYKRLTIRMNGLGVELRDTQLGFEIGTKRQFSVKKGQFILSKIDARNGAFGIVPDSCDKGIITGNFWTFDVDSDLLSKRFFEFLTKTPSFVDFCIRASDGTTNRRYLDEDRFLDQTIEVPSIDEQRRIVARIESLATRIDEAKQLRQAIQADMDTLLVAMAHRNDLGDEEKLAQGWERVALGDVLTQVSDPVTVEPGKEYPHFGIYSFARGLFKKAPLLGDEIKASKLYRVSEGQFIYGRLNAYEGAFAVISKDYDKHHVSNEFPAFECVSEKVLPEFLLAYFSTPVVWEALKRKVTGIGGGAGNRRIRLKESVLLSEEIWLPPISWQQKIKATAEQLATVKHDHESAGLELDALLPAILDKAFKGEL